MASILDTIGLESRATQRRRTPTPILERIARNVAINNETRCWMWQGSLNNWGYGQISVCITGHRPRNFSAHKASWEITHGERVPEGLQLDHLCRNRACVNPDHLEVVTPRENVRRSPDTRASINAAKTHCPQGHEYTPDNTYSPPGRDWRQCRICMRASSLRHQAARKAK